MSVQPIPLSQKGGSGALELSELLQFKRWNTPTIYNGWEQITKIDLTDGFDHPVNIEETQDYMPEMGRFIVS